MRRLHGRELRALCALLALGVSGAGLPACGHYAPPKWPAAEAAPGAAPGDASPPALPDENEDENQGEDDGS